MRRFWRQGVALVALALAVAAGLWCLSPSLAARPGGGGGGGGAGNNGGGLIYFWCQSSVYTMNDDGSGVTPIANSAAVAPQADPSRITYGGKRWFVQWLDVPGEFYPDGNRRCQFVFRSDVGDAVPLPLPADFQPLAHNPRWCVGDEVVSWVGRRWASGTVVEGGLYTTGLTFAGGNISGVTTSQLLVEFLLVPSTTDFMGRIGLVPDILSHDWSPDGTQFVFENDARDTLAIHTLGAGADPIFVDPVQRMSGPQWSPAGDKIMFDYFTGWNQVTLINTDGSGLKKLVGSSPNWSRTAGVWSPTGSHLLYRHRDHFQQDSYIVRVKVTGSGATRLTGPDLGWGLSTPQAMGWR